MSPARSVPLLLLALHAVPALAAPSAPAQMPTGPYPWNYPGTLPRPPAQARVAGACPATVARPRLLIAGDSWAQFMWDDDSHNRVLDRFGLADKRALSRSLGSNPGPGHGGPEYAISGSEAREWADTANFPWIANVIAELQAEPDIELVVFSLGGNDILAGRSGGGWYKDMDLDQAGSEAALFQRILGDSASIVQAWRQARPGLEVLVSSYEYPNFNVDPLWCFLYACPKRRDLSRDPDNALVTDAELNGLITAVESLRVDWTNSAAWLAFDHGVGAMHHYYGDGQSAPGVLPRPGQQAPDYLPFPGGNPTRPSLRSNFRTNFGVSADPIHLDQEGYLYKVALQVETHLWPRFRGEVSASLNSEGGNRDGWADGNSSGTEAVRVGDDGTRAVHGLLSFDTGMVPADAVIEAATLYLLREGGSGSNPFISGALGAPRLDLARGSFGAPEVEASDASAPADAVDVGCFVGSVSARHDALRIDIDPAALTGLGSRLQLRLSFASVNAGSDQVSFSDGDAVLTPASLVETIDQVQRLQPDGSTPLTTLRGSALPHRGLAEALGSLTPLLDLRWRSDLLLEDGFEG